MNNQVKSQRLYLPSVRAGSGSLMQWRQNHYDLQRVPQALGGCPFTSQFAVGDYRAIPQSIGRWRTSSVVSPASPQYPIKSCVCFARSHWFDTSWPITDRRNRFFRQNLRQGRQRNRVFYLICGLQQRIFVKKPGFWPPVRPRLLGKKKTAPREAVFDRTIVFATAGPPTFPTATNAGFTSTEV